MVYSCILLCDVALNMDHHPSCSENLSSYAGAQRTEGLRVFTVPGNICPIHTAARSRRHRSRDQQSVGRQFALVFKKNMRNLLERIRQFENTDKARKNGAQTHQAILLQYLRVSVGQKIDMGGTLIHNLQMISVTKWRIYRVFCI